jgi:NADH-quinone oxidoreductase subunit L
MAGPTPVSALIHAATMVTAGVYMVIALHFLFMLPEAAPALAVIAWIGALTAFLAATIAIAQADIKKVLAYSTVSQLGYMFLGLGVGVPGAALFHVVTHAFFKGLLFLGAGSVIHGMHGEQDMQKMGNLRRYMPITFWTMLAATLAISGVPPFSGFFSKDEIIWGAFAGPRPQPVLGVIGYVVALHDGRLHGPSPLHDVLRQGAASTITTSIRTSRPRRCGCRSRCSRCCPSSAGGSPSPRS